MKTLKQNITLIAAITISLISCQKNIETDKIASAQTDDAATNNLLKFNSCLIRHYQDDYSGFSFDISYNNHREPDSLQINSNGIHEATTFDKFGRLSKITFPYSTVQDYETLKYERSFLPSKLLYIVPNYKDYGQTDSVNAIIYFKYNYKGEMIQMKQTNVWYPGYDITYEYKYNNNGNVKSITHIPESGTAYTEYAFTSYDNEPNFMTGSIWIRYMLLNTGFDPFYQLLFSKNNPKDWTWYNSYGIPGAHEIFTSSFTYNNEGFANTVNLNVADNVYGDFTSTRSAISTCDNFDAISNNHSSNKSLIPLNIIKQYNQRQPSPYYHKKTAN